jgi:hypothetical protein
MFGAGISFCVDAHPTSSSASKNTVTGRRLSIVLSSLFPRVPGEFPISSNLNKLAILSRPDPVGSELLIMAVYPDFLKAATHGLASIAKRMEERARRGPALTIPPNANFWYI